MCLAAASLLSASCSGTVTLADYNDAPKSIMAWDSVTEGTQVCVLYVCVEHAGEGGIGDCWTLPT